MGEQPLMRWWAIALLLVACGDHASKLDDISAKPPAASPDAPIAFDAAAIDAWVGAKLAERKAAGAALVVVRDGKIVLAKGYGKRRNDAPGAIVAETPFAIGSISKQFACTAMYMLVDQGKLLASTSIATYYPELTRATDITLADLGGHVSGYRDYYPMDYVDAPRMTTRIAPDDLIARYGGLPLDFEPRSRFSYSNTGFVMIARVIERVSGVAYPRALDEWIFKPLGMAASTVRAETAASGHVAFLVDAPKPAPLEADGWLLGAADIWASATDLAKWDLAWPDLLSPASRTAMMTPATLANGRTTNYSCGFYVRIVNGLTVLSHGGWVGGFWTHNAIVPQTHSAVVLLTNDETVDLGGVADRILHLVTEDASAIPAIAGPSPEAVVRDLIQQLQKGTIDRSQLADDANAYFDAARIAASAASLRALGEPRIRLDTRKERGGMEATTLNVAFPSKTVTAHMFRSPDGKVHQLLLTP